MKDVHRTAIPVKIIPPTPVTPSPVSRVSIPSFTKTTPNELYRKLLPAVLFLLTFVTVMTILLIYMDTVALGAQQFRVNMSRDYDMARIPAESPTLVAYVRQLHLAPRAPRTPPPTPTPTARVAVLDRVLGELYNGTLVEFLPRGGRDPTAAFLETIRGWSGVAVRAAPRDFLALRGAARALHACLSPTDHPREMAAYLRHPNSFKCQQVDVNCWTFFCREFQYHGIVPLGPRDSLRLAGMSSAHLYSPVRVREFAIPAP
ncbi:jg14176 [Pararge aegeria aegeria]|uniref:Jg14176 protein n=1 Tax=Pararge aegeria aegeria TaxID=348720 RepID=A0A8S4SFX6_9NEOP|nr:jg14176 [Pararge aegeria aegeria]